MSSDASEICRAARELAREHGQSEAAIIAAGDVAALRLLGQPMHPAKRELISPYGTVAWVNEHWQTILQRAGIAEDPR